MIRAGSRMSMRGVGGSGVDDGGLVNNRAERFQMSSRDLRQRVFECEDSDDQPYRGRLW